MELEANSNHKAEFKQGVKAGVPIFMGYFSISITFGLIAKAADVSGFLAVFMSLTNFTGATQFIGINMLSHGMEISNIALTTFMINARYLLMSFCITNKLRNSVSRKLKALLSFGITDEVFVLAMTKENLKPSFIFGVQIISYMGWVLGTLLGTLIAGILPSSLSNSIGIAIYIMFLGLLLPAASKSLKVTIVAIIAMIISSTIYYIPLLNNKIGNWRVVITIILTSLIGAGLIPKEEDEIDE
jgi:4-azaleucine resistance transporter AzlC